MTSSSNLTPKEEMRSGRRELSLGHPAISLLAGLLTYVLLAFPIYSWLYNSVADDDAGTRYRFIFYGSYSLHLVLALAAAGAVAAMVRSSLPVALGLMAIALAVVAIPTLGFLSFLNECETGQSFPFGGMAC
jgi:ABC-type multidrug transport system permease subunit